MSRGRFSFPEVREPLAGVISHFPGFDAFTEDGNLQKLKMPLSRI
jgi:hypothetical protein